MKYKVGEMFRDQRVTPSKMRAEEDGYSRVVSGRVGWQQVEVHEAFLEFGAEAFDVFLRDFFFLLQAIVRRTYISHKKHFPPPLRSSTGGPMQFLRRRSLLRRTQCDQREEF